MLTAEQDSSSSQPSASPHLMNKPANANCESPSQLERMMRVEWLGQTFASLCWICSVFVYGITSAGDWLQLLAASAWLVANIAAIVTQESE